MAEVLTGSGRWTVSARSSGEVLAVRVGQSVLQMGFVGSPRGLQAAEIEGWLGELVGMAAACVESETPGPDGVPPLPIPRSLHQALTGLLFLQAEVWGDPADRIPLSLVLVEQGDRVAFGWSGSGRVTLLRSGEASEPAWTVVRDDQGREARALVAGAAGPMSVRAVWSATGLAGEPLEGVLEAEWPGRARETVGAGEMPLEASVDRPAEQAAEPVPERRPSARTRPFWHFRGWMEKLSRSSGEPAMPAAPEVSPEPAPPAGEPAPLPPCDLEPIAHDVAGVPDLIPEPEPRAIEAPAPAQPVGEAIKPEPEPEPEPEPFEVEQSTVELDEPEAPAIDDLAIASGATSETPAETTVARRSPVRRLEWPADEEPRRPPRLEWKRSYSVAAVVVGLFALGWVLGRVDLPVGARALGNAFGAIGLGPARYDVAITSRPAGAWITVDGADQARRTPTTLALKPGQHEIVLSLSGEGGSSHIVSGKRGEHVTLNVALWGSLRVDAPAGGVPLAVTVDGLPRGYAPFLLDRVQPGVHRLQFTGPGVTPWEQTVEVHVDRIAAVLAQPVVSPPTGVLEVRARLADGGGAEALAGAAVRIDGQQRGVTPLRLELPRGPHSIRVSYHGEEAPVQVIDLPGGNQRFATLDVGADFDQPRLAAALPGRVAVGQPTVLSASLDRAREGDVREMWLHVRTPEGAWRRYPMNMMQAPGGLVGVAVFPTDLFGERGRTSWYVSALAPTGDEYFTEIQPAQSAR
jgi:hypothetical protein